MEVKQVAPNVGNYQNMLRNVPEERRSEITN